MAMTHPQAQLKSFRMRQFEANGGASFKKNAQLNFNLEQEVEVGYAQQEDPSQWAIRGLVRIKLVGTLTDEENPNLTVNCTGRYEGFFEYAKDVNVPDVVNAFSDNDYTRFLVAQVFPLAVQHLKSQLTAMKVENDFFPIGLLPGTSPVK